MAFHHIEITDVSIADVHIDYFFDEDIIFPRTLSMLPICKSRLSHSG